MCKFTSAAFKQAALDSINAAIANPKLMPPSAEPTFEWLDTSIEFAADDGTPAGSKPPDIGVAAAGGSARPAGARMFVTWVDCRLLRLSAPLARTTCPITDLAQCILDLPFMHVLVWQCC